jgi:hypothetical protein
MWHVGTVVALHDETATARTIALEVSDWLGHVAGQHVDVRLSSGWILSGQVLLDRLRAELRRTRGNNRRATA